LFGLIESGGEDELPFTPVRIWDVATGKQLAALPGGEWHVQFASYSSDGSKILTAETNSQDEQLYSGAGALIQDTSSAEEGNEESFVRIYEAATGRELVKLPHVGPIDHAVFSPDAKRMVTSDEPSAAAAQSYAFHVWDADSGKKLFDLDRHDQNALAVFSPDGSKLFVIEHPTIRVYDAQQGKPLASVGNILYLPLDRKLCHAGFSPLSPGAKTLLAFDGDGLGLLDLDAGNRRVTFSGHSGHPRSAVFSGNGRFVVTASDDQTARVWEVATGQELYTLRHKNAVEFALQSDDGRLVATASDTVRIWRLDPLALAIHRKPRELTSSERNRFAAPSSHQAELPR
jgi:WD40 repeat protein